MSETEYTRLMDNGGLTRRLSGSSELGITQDLGYLHALSGRAGQSGKYNYLVEFNAPTGTLQKLIDAGATHPSAASLFPDLPIYRRGMTSPQIKLEKGGVLSVLLGGSDDAVGLFNSSVTGFRLVQ